MDKSTASETVLTMDSSGREARDVLTEILHHGAQQMLAAAIENEMAAYKGVPRSGRLLYATRSLAARAVPARHRGGYVHLSTTGPGYL